MKTARLLPLALIALFLPLFAHAAPAVTLSLSQATGVAPYTTTLTWSATGAAACVASDGWTGAKAASGTQQLTVSAPTKYTLTCTAADGSTTTTWTPPTKNTDGSPLTDNAGFNVYRGTSTTNLTKVKSVGPAVLSYQDTGLSPGAYYYAVTAVNAQSQESTRAQATPYPISVTGSSTAASASAGVTTTPESPGGVQVTVNVSVNVSAGP
jgi:hypothetical protein